MDIDKEKFKALLKEMLKDHLRIEIEEDSESFYFSVYFENKLLYDKNVVVCKRDLD